MRCEWCNYCRYDQADDMYECLLGIEESENRKCQCGCRYNKRTLDKLNKQYWEQEAKDILGMCKYFDKEIYK